MLYIAVALYKEAEQVIKKYQLKHVKNSKGISIYAGEDITLIITGYGNVAAAIGLSHALTLLEPAKRDCFVNIGSAGGHVEDYQKLFVGNKLVEMSTNRCFYPDVDDELLKIYSETNRSNILADETMGNGASGTTEKFKEDRNTDNGSIKETTIYTSPIPVGEVEIERFINNDSNDNNMDLASNNLSENRIFDMEAAALYQVAEKYFYQDRMMFVKYISDSGSDKAPDITISDTNLLIISEIIEKLVDKSKQKDVGTEIKKQIVPLVEKLSYYLNASETMKNDIFKLLQYRMVAYGDVKKLVEDFLNSKEITEPVIRKEGKKLLVELTNNIKNI